MEREGFQARPESSLLITPLNGEYARRVLLLGLGEGPDGIRAAAGLAGHRARRFGAEQVALLFGPRLDIETDLDVALLGFSEGQYRFDQFRAESERKVPCRSLVLHRPSGQPPSATWFRNVWAIREARAFARDLVNTPANALDPEALAALASSCADEALTVDVRDETWMREQGMGGLLAVGAGSARPPRFVHMRYRPREELGAPVAIVGKGVTFDAGGLCLKTPDGMGTMRSDMAGAATVLAVMRDLDAIDPPFVVHGIFGAAENLASGSAYKPGDILRLLNGKTVEVQNTDAEGRLLLADALAHASRLGVSTVIDVATLTGACHVALGNHYTGLFSTDQGLVDSLLEAARCAGEGLWRLPLSSRHVAEMKGEHADLKNLGPRWGGASTAAAFLSQFVSDARWAHLDIAGVAFLEKSARHFSVGATGVMVETLIRWILATSASMRES
jgi:leucyl aminopeptidase